MLHGYGAQLAQGTATTLALALGALAIATPLGLAGAAAKLSRARTARWMGNVYTTLTRGIPDLVLMLLVFYGGQAVANALAEAASFPEPLDIDPFTAGVATLGFIFGAYLAETFRGAILAIAPGQREAALAFGMTPRQVLARILLPQMIRFALPGFTNNWLVLVKSTALVSVIGLTDMMQRAGMAAGATREPFTFYLAAGAIYLAITTASLLVLRLVERHYARGVRVAA